MNTWIRTLALTLITSSGFALAKPVPIEDTKCVKASVEKAHDATVNYAAYASSPGSAYAIQITSTRSMTLLTMVKSQARFKDPKDPTKLLEPEQVAKEIRYGVPSDAFVLVTLRPTNLNEGRYYPSFVMRCTTAFPAQNRFTHHCEMLRDKPHYGLQNFTSDLSVSQDGCPATEPTRLSYNLVLDSNEAEVDQIKAKVLEPAGPVLGPIIGALFDVESFFTNYYVNFYNGWASVL